MSHTFRRKKEKPHNHSGASSCIYDFIYQRLDYWDGTKGIVTAWGGVPEVKLEGDALLRAQFKYYKDQRTGWGRYYSKSMRKQTHKTAKSKNKKYLHCALRRENYEFIEAPLDCLSWYA